MNTLKTAKKLVDGRKEFQYYTNNKNANIAVRKDYNYYTVLINNTEVRAEMTKLQVVELLTLIGAEKIA